MILHDSTVNSFVLVALSEMGDKTQLLAFSLASRFKRPWSIMAGIFCATILNHGLAAYFGERVSHLLNPQAAEVLIGISFIFFGFWTLKPDTLDEKVHPSNASAFLTTTVLFFLAEIGDKTQLATMALGAQYQAVLSVTVGTTFGMLVSDGLAVIAGDKLSGKVQMKYVRWFTAGLFFVYGAALIFSAFHR